MIKIFSFRSQYYFLIGAVLLSFSHYLAAVYLPSLDCDETYNFIEPIHFLLYGTGKQTWENCPAFGLRGWIFALLYSLPALVRYRVLPLAIRSLSNVLAGTSLYPVVSPMVEWATVPPRSLDVYFFLRVVYGQVGCIAELFFVSSIRSAYSVGVSGHRNRTALIALGLLLTSSCIPHAAVSTLTTSFSMICYFFAVGCWLRAGVISRWLKKDTKEKFLEEDRDSDSDHPYWSNTSDENRKAVESSETQALFAFLCVALMAIIGFVGWPFACLIGLPMMIDLFCRYPSLIFWSSASISFFLFCCVLAVDTFFFCTPTLSTWNLVRYNVLGGGDSKHFGVEPWYYCIIVLLQFNFVFLAALCSPLVLFFQRRSRPLEVRLSLLRLCAPLQPVESKGQMSLRGDTGRSLLKKVFYSYPPHFKPYHSLASEGCYVLSFFIWVIFWMFIPHKKERFVVPVYPFLILAATITLSRLLMYSASEDGYINEVEQFCHHLKHFEQLREKSKYQSKRNRGMLKNFFSGSFSSSYALGKSTFPGCVKLSASSKASVPKSFSSSTYSSSVSDLEKTIRKQLALSSRQIGLMVLIFFLYVSGLISLSRGLAVHHFYGGTQQMLYDAYPALSDRTQQKWRNFNSSLPDANKGNELNESSTKFASTGTAISRLEIPSARIQYRLCVGHDWHALPSSFFLDFHLPLPFPFNHTDLNSNSEKPFRFPSLYDYYSLEVPSTPVSTQGFLDMGTDGIIPLDFFPSGPESTGLLNLSLSLEGVSPSLMEGLWPKADTIPRACHCASPLVNDLNLPISIQHVQDPSSSCDAVFSSFGVPPSSNSKLFQSYLQDKEKWDAKWEEEMKQSYLYEFSQTINIPRTSLTKSAKEMPYRVLDTSRTPRWCQALYFPFGITESCAVWRKLVLQEKPTAK